MKVEPKALDTLAYYSAGFPKTMHLIGDAAYWTDQDGLVDERDANTAAFRAAEEVG
jgi:hypothetical protein